MVEGVPSAQVMGERVGEEPTGASGDGRGKVNPAGCKAKQVRFSRLRGPRRTRRISDPDVGGTGRPLEAARKRRPR